MASDTIAAISTGVGGAGIGIVRISGPQAIAIGSRVFRGKQAGSMEDQRNQYVRYGVAVDPDSGEAIDECLALVMRGPHSYTAEDVVEINCHGGTLVTGNVLSAVLRAGARLAEPGEFTRRAYVNERIDLSQAEAVIDIIEARTARGLTEAVNQLQGSISSAMKRLQRDLVAISAELEAAIDFSDEDLDILPRERIVDEVTRTLREVDALWETAEQGRIVKEGVVAAIIGRPNVGKSSLLNALLGHDRAIVTAEPGTTRDVIDEMISLKSIPLRILDTAGIRDTSNSVEVMGVEKAKDALERASLVLLVVDASERLTNDDRRLFKLVKEKNVVAVLNKVDLRGRVTIVDVEREGIAHVVAVSATERLGLEKLEAEVAKVVFTGRPVPDNGAMITNLRQQEALRKAKSALQEAVMQLKSGASEEIVVVAVKASLTGIGEIVGETTPEDILDGIFGRFCIGK